MAAEASSRGHKLLLHTRTELRTITQTQSVGHRGCHLTGVLLPVKKFSECMCRAFPCTVFSFTESLEVSISDPRRKQFSHLVIASEACRWRAQSPVPCWFPLFMVHRESLRLTPDSVFPRRAKVLARTGLPIPLFTAMTLASQEDSSRDKQIQAPLPAHCQQCCDGGGSTCMSIATY